MCILKRCEYKYKGRWPGEYGVGVKEERLAQSTKCAICTQKGCFIVSFELIV